MSDSKQQHPSNREDEEWEYNFGTGQCDLCGNSNTQIHELRILDVCMFCAPNFDDILDSILEQFSIQQETALPPLLAELCKEQKGVCGICNERIEPWETMHIDHILPRSKGGTDDRRNLQAAHAVCNLRKGNRTPASEGGTATRQREPR